MDISSIPNYAACMNTTDLAARQEAKPMHPRRAATRARICEAANQLFFERGFPLVTMEQIAAAADIQRSTLYLHFREKDEILAAIAEDYTAKVRAVVAQLPGPVPSLKELQDWVGFFAGLVAEERASTELLVTLSHLPNAPAPALAFGEVLKGMMAERLSAFRQALEPGQHFAFARAMFAMDNLGWALCYFARNGANSDSLARLSVAAENLNRVVRGDS
jgi:AcrR family transcriptional regulator